jgi:hypothetical protein
MNRQGRRQAAKGKGAPKSGSLLEALVGHRVIGGCEDCSAYQDVTRVDGIYHITIAHDVTCPWLNAREGTR